MPRYFLSFAGREQDRSEIECDDMDAARNEAVRRLGAYLTDHPSFSNEGHWRINVENNLGQPILHVIVATVTPRKSKQAEV